MFSVVRSFMGGRVEGGVVGGILLVGAVDTWGLGNEY